MASVTYGKCIMANVIMAKIFMAKILWQMKLSLLTWLKAGVCRGWGGEYRSEVYMCVLHDGNGLCVHIHLETVDGNWAGKIVFLIFRICVNNSAAPPFFLFSKISWNRTSWFSWFDNVNFMQYINLLTDPASWNLNKLKIIFKNICFLKLKYPLYTECILEVGGGGLVTICWKFQKNSSR